eukprot:CAMPEP_0117445860 /NCGR_PEP_ID=MMETSP0759-20121206/6025_1 /TAXON_ID=63605 /ORGANISM="Percolomonas cosmopolitus, Strain WS" /LENGTH=170 /DNA_ID=CAMNT_0005238073 /DNA_START=92 /DNA_END=604 /DNA_ORIENTATION=-
MPMNALLQQSKKRLFHTSSMMRAKTPKTPHAVDKLTKLTRASVRTHFKSEDERQWHYARQLFLHRDSGYGREGHVMKFNFYKDRAQKKVTVQARKEYPDWIFQPETYERITADKTPQWTEKLDEGKLNDREIKRYRRTLRRFKMKLYLQHGKNWKKYWTTLMEGKYDFYE